MSLIRLFLLANSSEASDLLKRKKERGKKEKKECLREIRQLVCIRFGQYIFSVKDLFCSCIKASVNFRLMKEIKDFSNDTPWWKRKKKLQHFLLKLLGKDDGCGKSLEVNIVDMSKTQRIGIDDIWQENLTIYSQHPCSATFLFNEGKSMGAKSQERTFANQKKNTSLMLQINSLMTSLCGQNYLHFGKHLAEPHIGDQKWNLQTRGPHR